MSRIIGNTSYRLRFTLVSPLAVGAGENEETDKDVALNSSGEPYIPGSAMAGVLRNHLRISKGETAAEKFFGADIKGEEGEANIISESRVITYDAKIIGKYNITKRDMVSLEPDKTIAQDEESLYRKVSKPGGKFDFQIIEPNDINEKPIEIVTYLEEMVYDDDIEFEDSVRQLLGETIAIGGKTTRGYGKVKLKELHIAKFDMHTEIDNWLEFDIYDDNSPCWNKITKEKASSCKYRNSLDITVNLKQRGGISIRQYSTKVNQPDYIHMRMADGTPIIPGTSWAGAIRHHMKKLWINAMMESNPSSNGINDIVAIVDSNMEDIFGNAKSENDNGTLGHKSYISIDESRISGGIGKKFTRNAIDRFTGGTVEGALYTEETWYHGRTSLHLSIENCTELMIYRDELCKLLAATIVDLSTGCLAVGGLTAVGRGLFEFDEDTDCVIVNGRHIENNGRHIGYRECYELINDAWREALKGDE